MQMCNHPLTTAGLEQFMKDWESVPKDQFSETTIGY